MTVAGTQAPVHPSALRLSRRHLDRMTGQFGLFQHASGSTPALEHGSCTDDMARVLMVDLRHRQRARSASIDEAVERDLLFLEQGFSRQTGRFRNLRSTSGTWLDDAGTADSHGRAIQGLGWAVALSPHPGYRARAARLLSDAIPAAATLSEARPLSYVILGCLRAAGLPGVDQQPLQLATEACQRLALMTQTGDPSWPWPDDVVTYDNGVIPQALIEAGVEVGRPEIVELGLRCLEWLIAAQTSAGYLTPVGNQGWWPRGGTPARYEQQPIEPASLVEACAAAYRASGARDWLREAQRSFAWFLGANDLGLPVADPDDGSCHDGLGETTMNHNRGAESSLAWLMSVETMVDLRAQALVPSGRSPAQG